MADVNGLSGLRVLIPRGGDIGTRLAEAVAARDGVPVIAPAIAFVEASDTQAVTDACARLSGGEFDWVAITSATTVETLVRHDVRIPEKTRVAVVGPATGDAMLAAGFPVHFMPSEAFSAVGMIADWPASSGSVLLPQSAIAEPTLADGLAARGLAVTTIPAYDTTVVDWDDDMRRQWGSGVFAAVLLTSASVARAVASQGTVIPEQTVIACIGQSTASGARAAGLPVHVVAESSTAEGLVNAASDYFLSVQNPTHQNPTHQNHTHQNSIHQN
jgi:uroporphyrinogen-III synthase